CLRPRFFAPDMVEVTCDHRITRDHPIVYNNDSVTVYAGYRRRAGGEGMISIRWAVVAVFAIVTCAALLAGCGNTFRPTINFQPQPSGDPSSLGHAVVLSTNPAGGGSDTHINVSGDTNVGVVNVGLNPVFLGKALGRAFVINGDNTVTLYIALLPTSTVASRITLPGTTSGAVGGGASANGNIYIANSGTNNVSVI